MNNLISFLKSKIDNTTKAKDINENYININLCSDKDLENFLTLSISEFKQFCPQFCEHVDTIFYETYADILVEGAMVHFLSRQAIIEQSKAYSDNLVETSGIANMLLAQYEILSANHFAKLQYLSNK